MSIKSKITYFDKIGEDNTDELIKIVSDYQKKTGIKYIIISSNSGKSALKLLKEVDDVKIIAVTLHSGFHEDDDISWDERYKEELLKNDVTCFMGTHALSGINRGMSRRFGGFNPSEIVAEAYKTISVGIKVAIEVSIMAADAGLIPTNEEVLAIGGHSGKGVDSAIVLTASHMNNFFDLSVHEILAMTRD